MSAVTATPDGEYLPEVEIDGPARQRRLTVLFRVLLAIPQYIVLYILSIAAAVVLVIGWFAALILGRLPSWAADFLSGYVGYLARVTAYNLLLVDRYPPFDFTAPGYPVRVGLRPGRLNRLAVLFRIILGIPAAIVASVLVWGWGVCAVFCWIAVLIAGRAPDPLFGATAAVLRYYVRYQAYFSLLTPAYPKRLFGDPQPWFPSGEGGSPVTTAGPYGAAGQYGPTGQYAAGQYGPAPAGGGTRPLVLSAGARALLIVFIVIGALAFLGYGAGISQSNSQSGTTQTSQY